MQFHAPLTTFLQFHCYKESITNARNGLANANYNVSYTYAGNCSAGLNLVAKEVLKEKARYVFIRSQAAPENCEEPKTAYYQHR